MKNTKWCNLGVSIKKSLIDKGQTQEWLISEMKLRTGQYVDSSNLYKIMTGQLKSEKLVTAIQEILNIKQEEGGIK